ncbi:hypothetical protein K469DRAFT_708725 [Zopfia rhizophila CBS 207.26]|uniref:Uncharacterized protein n=1 Tax=Zopfia rhizophila CBS 207.26 TaxID=1314779 RepID=A0A6A6E0K6_9PEZI|nr:hypothetical protein K469DRAFT_708725 [Zopfia rhizophila CBS 207.26]
MTGTSRKQQHRKRTLTPVRNSALAAVASSSAIYTLPTPHMTTTMRSDIQRPSSYYPTSATPTVPSIATSIPDDHHRPPPQPAVATYSWDNINSGIECNLPANGSHHRLASLSIERFDLHRFGPHKGANVEGHLLPKHPKLTAVEPRIIYECSANCTFPFPTPLS